MSRLFSNALRDGLYRLDLTCSCYQSRPVVLGGIHFFLIVYLHQKPREVATSVLCMSDNMNIQICSVDDAEDTRDELEEIRSEVLAELDRVGGDSMDEVETEIHELKERYYSVYNKLSTSQNILG